MSRWVAYYSGTGQEIKALSKQPDIIYTDNPDAGIGTILVADFYSTLRGDDIVTLHGWMRIVPPSVCEAYNIYNGHPGLIDRFPELKGKDPQARSESYKVIGSVIHRVTPEIDGGEILFVSARVNNQTDIFKQLRQTSRDTWESFITKMINTTKNNGGPTHYYDLKPEWKGIGDVIEGREMNFNQGSILKAAFCFNIGRHSATTYERELNKIVYFAQRELKRCKSKI